MPGRRSPRILVLDIGGTHVKLYFSDLRRRFDRFPSGAGMTPGRMIRELKRRLGTERYDRVAVGYPGLVLGGRIARDPPHLGRGWTGYDFERALGRPTRVLNDAAMQALGSYRGGSMLFLGLGSGLGTALIVHGHVQPMEAGHLPYRKGRSFEEYVGDEARQRLGRRKWRKEVLAVLGILEDAFQPGYIVLGGGNVRHLSKLPPRVLRGRNENAFVGGVRLWTDSPPGAVAPPAGRRRRARGRRRASG